MDIITSGDSLPFLLIVLGLPAICLAMWLGAATRTARRAVKDEEQDAQDADPRG